MGAIVTGIAIFRKQSAETDKGSRTDTFNEMKAMIDLARMDAKEDNAKRSSERMELLKKIDVLNQDHMHCLERAAKLDSRVESLVEDVNDLRKQITQLRRLKGLREE